MSTPISGAPISAMLFDLDVILDSIPSEEAFGDSVITSDSIAIIELESIPSGEEWGQDDAVVVLKTKVFLDLEGVEIADTTIRDIIARRGPSGGGWNGVTLAAERAGGGSVPLLSIEPDPNTFRGEFYYNCQTNQLFKKVTVRRDVQRGAIVCYWKNATSY